MGGGIGKFNLCAWKGTWFASMQFGSWTSLEKRDEKGRARSCRGVGRQLTSSTKPMHSVFNFRGSLREVARSRSDVILMGDLWRQTRRAQSHLA